MASERTWPAVSEAFTANGTAAGAVTVGSTDGFKVKARVILFSSTQPRYALEIKAVLSEVTILLGPADRDMALREDVSRFTLADGATILQEKQKRPSISPGDYERAMYEEEPAVALRTTLVDKQGNTFGNSANPFIVGSLAYDEIDITRDVDGDISRAVYKLLSTPVRTLDLLYNAEKSLIKVLKS